MNGYIVLDEKPAFFVLCSPRIDHLAASGAGFLVMYFYDMTFGFLQLEYFKINTQYEKYICNKYQIPAGVHAD
jgi:hypothetical protein